MEILRVHHVAFAHREGEQPHAALERLLGLRVTHSEDAGDFTERMIPAGDCYVQLLEATGPGVVQRFLDRRGPALHHIAFAVADLDAALAELREAGARLVDEHARPGGMGTRIAFLHPSEVGGLLVELVEEPDAHDGRG